MLFWQGEAKGGTDKRIAEAGRTRESIHLFYREIHHTPFEYMGQVVLLHPPKQNMDGPSDFVFKLIHDQSVVDDLETCRHQIDTLVETEREQVIAARRGQGRFREALLNFWERKCAVTEVDHPSVLTASHIKPWRHATNPERTDCYNGLLLLPQYDRLFDRGLITFDKNGCVQISKAFPENLWTKTGISPQAKLTRIDSDHRAYLEFHREKVFVEQTGD